MIKLYNQLRPYWAGLAQIIVGFLFVAFTLQQCTQINYRFEPGKVKIKSVLADHPMSYTAESGKYVKFSLRGYPNADLSYTPKNFMRSDLPPLFTMMHKGDSIALETFADDLNRKIKREPTFTEEMFFGGISIHWIEVQGRRFANRKQLSENERPDFMNIFLIYTVVCATFIISGYLKLVSKAEEMEKVES